MFYEHHIYKFSPFHHWAGRHHGRRGQGHFVAGFMGGRDGSGFRTGRKLAAADLQLLILALLEEKPSHGYELIKALEERSGGFYSPSPGMIYPALTYLEEIGHATVEAEGAKKLYRLTEAGRGYLDQNRATVEVMLGELSRIGSKMERMRQVFSGEDGPGGDEFGMRRSEEFHAARHALRSALLSKRHSSPEEIKRIAEILRRAAAEIVGK